MTKERRLGRGLEALLGKLPDAYPEVASAAAAPTAPSDTGPLHVSVYEVDRNPFQPRHDFDDAEIDSLADSIHEHGLIQPIVVRRQGERYQLIAGERRLRASIKAGLSQVPVQVMDVDDRQAAELAIVENLQRKDLNPLEKGASFQQYLERYQCTQDELARRLKIDRSTVANLIRLLELPEAVQGALRAGTITQGHARALLPLGEEHEQIDFCQRIQQEGLSVRAIEELVQLAIQAPPEHALRIVSEEPAPTTTKKSRSSRSGQVASLEQQLRVALGTKVDLRVTAQGRGRIVVHFKNHDEFERLYDQFCEHEDRSQGLTG